LDSSSLKVLKIAAVLGDEFNKHLLEKFIASSENKFIIFVKLACQNHFIIKKSEDLYCFSHENISVKLCLQNSSEEKRNYHLEIAREC